LQPITNTPTLSFTEFLKLGIGHILNVDAFDHLLFLIALLLGCRELKTMLLVITGFTVAHSVTLTLAALNWVNVSPRLIEPMIAASIIFVPLENFRSAEKSWRRYALTCGFGLIHGFGFASSLRASGLGGNGLEIVRPLLGFNLGVEIGQLVVAAVVLPLLLGLNRWPWFARHGVRMISGLVILVATVWLWERLR
jgi:HupE / UreJ protein